MSGFAEQLAAALAEPLVGAIRELRAPAAPQRRWGTPAEAEEHSGLPASVIRRLAKEGVLPWMKYLGRGGMRVDLRALDRLEAQGGIATIPPIPPDNATRGGIGGM